MEGEGDGIGVHGSGVSGNDSTRVGSEVVGEEGAWGASRSSIDSGIMRCFQAGLFVERDKGVVEGTRESAGRFAGEERDGIVASLRIRILVLGGGAYPSSAIGADERAVGFDTTLSHSYDVNDEVLERVAHAEVAALST